jgi:hypothetical protein
MGKRPDSGSSRAIRAASRTQRLSATGLPGVVTIASLLGGKPHYIHLGWFQISVANFAVIVLMIVVFVLAIVLPFPGEREKR